MKTVFAKKAESFSLILKVDPDKMKLFVDAEPLGKPVSRDDFLATLKEFTKNEELNAGVIDDIVKHLNTNEKIKDRRILKGIAPQNGADGKLLLLIKKFTGHGEVKVDDKGVTSYAELNLFDNVHKDQVVARIYPPKNGVDGKDVLGGAVRAKPGKPAAITLDKSLKITDAAGEEFKTVVAQAEGYLCEESGKLIIKDELIVKHDLDYRYGNLDFVGKVKINGDVLPGFNIKARTGIEITGSVRGGSLYCAEGDIVVKGFVFGGQSSRIISGKNFTASVVQEINAEIVSNITILKEARDSSLRAQGTIHMKNGTLMGGQAFTAHGVEAKYIGNDAGVTTIINLCSDIETTTEYAKITVDIENHDKAMNLIKLHLGPLADNQSRIQLLQPPHRDRMEKLLQKYQLIENSRAVLLERRTQLLESAKPVESHRVNFISSMSPGTKVRSGEEQFMPPETLKGPASLEYIVNEKKFILGAIKPLEESAAPAEQKK